MKTLLKYPGSKWRIADWIISHFPEHKIYCEPFFGSGAVFFNKTPVYSETINDIDGDIVNLFKICREYPEELATLINLTPFSRTEFINCNLRTDNPLEQARRTIAERLKNTQIECIDAIELIKRYNDENTLIYLDPPYLPDLRKKNIYKCEMDADKHIELLKAITQSKSKIAISGYDNELYNELLVDWQTDQKDTIAQMGLPRTEKLWMNYDLQLKLL